MVRSTIATGDWTWHLPSTSFECRTTPPLVGPHERRKQASKTGYTLFFRRECNYMIYLYFYLKSYTTQENAAKWQKYFLVYNSRYTSLSLKNAEIKWFYKFLYLTLCKLNIYKFSNIGSNMTHFEVTFHLVVKAFT